MRTNNRIHRYTSVGDSLSLGHRNYNYVENLKYFVDEQRFGPYSLWHHKQFIKPIPWGVEMIDIVDYKLPLGVLGKIGTPLLLNDN